MQLKFPDQDRTTNYWDRAMLFTIEITTKQEWDFVGIFTINVNLG